MRILLLTNERTQRNGWATVALELAVRLAKHHRVTVLSEQGDSANPGLDLITSNGYKTPRKLRLDVGNIIKRLEDDHFDVVICAVERHLPLATRLKHRLDSPWLVLVGHGTYIYYPFVRGIRSWLNRRAARAVDKLVVPSQFTADRVRSWYRGAIEVVPWGVNTAAYYPLSDIKKEQAFLFVGAQKPRKGMDDLLEGFALLASEFPEVRLYLVGSTSERYNRKIIELGIEPNVVKTGVINHAQLLEYYARSLCHVLPSVNTHESFEGFGLVHLEANACGIPSIGARGTANQEIIAEGISGFLCTSRDPESVYRCMRHIISDQAATQKMFKSSLVHAQHYTWERVIETFEERVLPV